MHGNKTGSLPGNQIQKIGFLLNQLPCIYDFHTTFQNFTSQIPIHGKVLSGKAANPNTAHRYGLLAVLPPLTSPGLLRCGVCTINHLLVDYFEQTTI